VAPPQPSHQTAYSSAPRPTSDSPSPPLRPQDSLGGNAKTMIIANVSPSPLCAAERVSTLQFASRA